MSGREQQYRYRPTYVLDVDTIFEWIDYMLDILESQVNETNYQNCITVLDHLMDSDELVYGDLLQQEGKKIEGPTHGRSARYLGKTTAPGACLV